MNITIKRTVNLSEPVLPEVLSAPLYEGEKNAHTFALSAVKDKLPHALSGSVVAYFERNDGNTVRVEGETHDGCAILTLSPECYHTGVFYLAVMLIADGAQTVIYAASGRVRNTQDGEIIDGGNTIPTYDEIMAHLNKYLSTDITAKVEETEDGARITMKDVVNGETTAVVKNGKPGKNGATFRPTVSENGILSWTNDKDLANPEPVDIKGPKGDSVKIKRVDESTEDGGTNVMVFSDGSTLRVRNGKTGAPGKNGKSAYEVAKENGFEGTEEEWLKSLEPKTLKNLVDAEATNAIRALGSAEESEEYKVGNDSAAFGYGTKVPGKFAFAAGYKNEASMQYATAFGVENKVSGAFGAFAAGVRNEVSGGGAYAFGSGNKAPGQYASVEGYHNIASSRSQHVQGRFNVEDAEDKYAHIVGNGSESKRANAHTVDWNGNAWYAGDIFVGGTGQDDPNAEKLVKQSDLDAISSGSDKILIIQLKVAPTTTIAYYHDYKYTVIKEAIDSGKAVILIDPHGKVYTLNYVLAGENGSNDNYLFHATAEYVQGKNANKLIADTLNIATDNYAYIYKTELKAPSPRSLRIYDDSPQFIDEYDGSETKQIYLPTKLQNPFALHIRGAVNADYDGSTETTVNIPVGNTNEGGTGGNASAFVVKVTYYFDQNDNGDESIYTADKTHAEIREAVERGDIVICELNYNYKAHGATGSTGFNPLYLPYVTRSRNNLLCFAATFQNGFVFPYSGADSNHVVVTLDKNATPNVYFKSFVHKSDLPLELPNPKYLVITQGTKRWDYKGFEEVKVDLEPPTTSLPWTAITDKPFGDAVVFNDQITFANAMMPILTPFTLVPGKTYKIIAGYPPEDGMEFTAVAEKANLLGVPVIGLGNYGALIEGGEDTGEVYAIISIPNGVDFSGNGTLVYGLIGIVDPTLQSMFVGNTFPVRIEDAEGAKPIPTEWINYGVENKGKLLRVKDDGTLEPFAVGKGLKMDGDALTVDEGEWELIEKTTMPETATITRTAEPDGTPYNFKAVMVIVKIFNDITSGGMFVYCGDEDLVNLYHGAVSMGTYTQQIGAYEFYPNRGRWDGALRTFRSVLATYQYSVFAGNDGTMPPSVEEYPNITKLRSATEYQAGTIIEIWGVRA